MLLRTSAPIYSNICYKQYINFGAVMVEMKYFLDYFLLYQLVEKIMEVHKQSVKFLVAYLFFLEEKK